MSNLKIFKDLDTPKPGLIRTHAAATAANKAFTEETIQNIMDVADGSVTMAPHELRQFFSATNRNATFNRSTFMDATEDYYGGSTTDSICGKQKNDLLFGHFLEILQSRTNDSEIFDTIKDLIQACTDAITESNTMDNRLAKRDAAAKNASHCLWLVNERDTWRLLYALYKDRLIVQKEANDYDGLPLSSSEKDIIEHLFANNCNLREYQLIVDWLEQSASERETSQIGYYTDRTVGWENTLLQLKNVDQAVFGTAKDLKHSLDPDAPHREGLRLHDLDVEDQKRLSTEVILNVAFLFYLISLIFFPRS